MWARVSWTVHQLALQMEPRQRWLQGGQVFSLLYSSSSVYRDTQQDLHLSVVDKGCEGGGGVYPCCCCVGVLLTFCTGCSTSTLTSTGWPPSPTCCLGFSSRDGAPSSPATVNNDQSNWLCTTPQPIKCASRCSTQRKLIAIQQCTYRMKCLLLMHGDCESCLYSPSSDETQTRYWQITVLGRRSVHPLQYQQYLLQWKWKGKLRWSKHVQEKTFQHAEMNIPCTRRTSTDPTWNCRRSSNRCIGGKER